MIDVAKGAQYHTPGMMAVAGLPHYKRNCGKTYGTLQSSHTTFVEGLHARFQIWIWSKKTSPKVVDTSETTRKSISPTIHPAEARTKIHEVQAKEEEKWRMSAVKQWKKKIQISSQTDERWPPKVFF